MRVRIAAGDAEVAQRVRVALNPLADLLTKRTDQADCLLQVTSGIVIAQFHATDGTPAQVVVGVRPLAAAITSGAATLSKYANLLCTWAKRKQDSARLGIWSPR